MSSDPVKDSNFQDQNTISDLNSTSNLDWEVFWHSELPKEDPTNTFETTDLIPQNQASIPSEPTNLDSILPYPNEPPNLPNSSHPHQTPPSRLMMPFLKTYSRKKVTHKASDMETSTHHEIDPTTGNELTLNELDVPIALKKGQRSCTQHPTSKFLGYSHSMVIYCLVGDPSVLFLDLSSTYVKEKNLKLLAVHMPTTSNSRILYLPIL